MAMTHFCDGAGGYAELAVVDAGLAAPIGPAVSFTAAAATPLAAGTAQDVLARLALPAGSEGARGDSRCRGSARATVHLLRTAGVSYRGHERRYCLGDDIRDAPGQVMTCAFDKLQPGGRGRAGGRYRREPGCR